MKPIGTFARVCIFLGLFAMLAYGLEQERKINLLKWQLEEQKKISHFEAEKAADQQEVADQCLRERQ